MILLKAGRSLVVHVLNAALPPQRFRTDIRLEHQDSVSHTAQKKREKERKKEKKIINIKIIILFFKKESYQTNKQIHQ